MEPRYNLPFRPSDIRTTPGWSAHPPPGYAIVSPQQQQEHHHQHQQQLGVQAQLLPPPPLPPPHHQPSISQQTHVLGPIQSPDSFQYGQYHPSHAPEGLAYNTQPVLAYGQSYPVMRSHSVMDPTTPKDLQSLPLPSQILPSQHVSQGPCLACGKSECTLSSHRHFSKYIQTNARRKRHSSSTASTPRSTQTTVAVSSQASSLHSAPSTMILDSQREQLLALWSKEWAPIKRGPERHMFPDKFIDRIMPAAQTHSPLFHALLAYSGTIWAIANNVMSDVASAQQAFAVELLSQACPTEREASTDEGMLAATLLLLVYMAQGNGFEVGKHVSGLVHLAKLRGGPHYLGLSGLVAEMLICADHMQAIFFNHEPVWELTLPPLSIGDPPRIGRGFEKVFAAHELEAPLASAAKSVCRVADVLAESAGGRTLSHVSKHAFSYLSSIAEYQLARCNAAYAHVADAHECICLALILFNYVVLNNDGAITPSSLQVEHRFWHSLEAAEAKGLKLEMRPALYMWMIVTGLTVSVRAECQYRHMGADRLRKTGTAAGLRTWEHFRRDVLDEFVWLPEAQEDTFRGIWAEVEGRSHVSGTPLLAVTQRNVLPPAG